MVEITVLISVGRHPVTKRSRRADLDARAVELGLRLADARVHLLHCGSPDEPCLRDYAGMGVASTTVLQSRDDILRPLAAHLRKTAPALVLAGLRGESGEDSGLLPYLLAEELQRPLLASVVDLDGGPGGWQATQLLAKGRRQIVSTLLPAIATVAPGAPPPRISAFARARRASIDICDEFEGTGVESQMEGISWEKQQARRRPKRMNGPELASQENKRRGAIQNATPQEAATMIWDYLVRERIIASRRSQGGE